MGSLIITKSKLNGTVKIVSSKSLSHRYLISAAFAKKQSIIENVLDSKDIDATIDFLTKMGVKVIVENTTYYISSKGLNYNKQVIDVNESGSSLRFFIPIAWLLNETVYFTAKKSLLNRPLTVYEDIAKKFNYELENDLKENISLKGPLKAGTYIVDGTISSQFITGLLFALTQLKTDSKIIIKNKIASKDYLKLTLDVLRQANIKIKQRFNHFYIKGNQEYQPLTTKVEGDYSQAAFFIVAALITKSDIKIANLNKASYQGDKKILNIVKKMGAKFAFNNNDLLIKGTNLNIKNSKINLYNIPDLGPILMVLAATIEKETTFYNIDRLKTKESNRYLAIKNNLEKYGVKFIEKNNTVKIIGLKNNHQKMQFETYNDHRIAMALSIYALINDEDVTINDYEVIDKSYKSFYEDLESLGGKITYVKRI